MSYEKALKDLNGLEVLKAESFKGKQAKEGDQNSKRNWLQKGSDFLYTSFGGTSIAVRNWLLLATLIAFILLILLSNGIILLPLFTLLMVTVFLPTITTAIFSFIFAVHDDYQTYCKSTNEEKKSYYNEVFEKFFVWLEDRPHTVQLIGTQLLLLLILAVWGGIAGAPIVAIMAFISMALFSCFAAEAVGRAINYISGKEKPQSEFLDDVGKHYNMDAQMSVDNDLITQLNGRVSIRLFSKSGTPGMLTADANKDGTWKVCYTKADGNEQEITFESKEAFENQLYQENSELNRYAPRTESEITKFLNYRATLNAQPSKDRVEEINSNDEKKDNSHSIPKKIN